MPPKLLIATRFGIGVRDPAWLEHRLVLLASVTAPSLLAQEDDNFAWAVFVDKDLASPIRRALEDILSEFQGRAFIDEGGHSPANLLRLARAYDLVDRDGYVLTGRIDDDDAWHRRTVGLVRERVARWREDGRQAKGIGLTFENGLVWVMYDMIDLDRRERTGETIVRSTALRPFRFAFHSMSGFVYASVADGLTPIGISHQEVPQMLASNGCEVEVIDTEEPMWLYCRHRQTDSPVGYAADAPALAMSVSDLADRFGIDEDRVRDYISNAERWGYARAMRYLKQRNAVRRQLRDVRQGIKHAAADDADEEELARLRDEEKRLRGQMTALSENLVSAPEA